MREVDLTTTDEALAAGGYVLDVREADEFAAVHVPGVTHIPLSELVARVAEVPAEGTVHVICAMGGRSLQGAEYLESTGRTAVSVEGGTQAWIQSGRPVVRG
ncbi:Rhodanese-related sulfurtransferase [Sanguibacter gelidistatuariae]|uniref:Rhodanese-related sulfurtransferase n=1 Tax=Sanguibacter gelidistatuariae TaxID=1814289 RepID=A0A1G6H509_9MICO|nr:rhodanese-like domain-containing protein [Sanguibacter gelidistatuariae]SDB89015.1 Rhodanese-related sulfurtransferase [Sanguibacter gelidistatuariae]